MTTLTYQTTFMREECHQIFLSRRLFLRRIVVSFFYLYFIDLLVKRVIQTHRFQISRINGIDQCLWSLWGHNRAQIQAKILRFLFLKTTIFFVSKVLKNKSWFLPKCKGEAGSRRILNLSINYHPVFGIKMVKIVIYRLIRLQKEYMVYIFLLGCGAF